MAYLRLGRTTFTRPVKSVALDVGTSLQGKDTYLMAPSLSTRKRLRNWDSF